MEIKIDIISGFLGAGKTTLIKKLIYENFKEEKIKETVSIIEKINPKAKIIRAVLNKIDFSEIINFEKDIRIYEENEIIVDEKYEYNNLINVKHSYNIFEGACK